MKKITIDNINTLDVKEEENIRNYYIVEDVRTSNYNSIEDALQLREIKNEKEAEIDDIFIIKNKKGDKITYSLAVMLRDGFMVYEHHGCIENHPTVYDLRFLMTVQRLFLQHHSVPTDTKRKVILLEGYGTMPNTFLPATNKLKSRFIIERDFNPDEEYEIGTSYTTRCLLGYYSDNINIYICRNEKGQYRLKIDRADKDYQENFLDKACDIEIIPKEGLAQACIGCQTIATFNCYNQAKEALVDIVKDIDKCEVFGVLKRAHSYDCYTSYNNETLIRAFNLHKI